MEGAVTLASLIEQLGTMFTTMMTNVVTVAETIVDTPLLLLGTSIFFAGACIGMFKRILSAS